MKKLVLLVAVLVVLSLGVASANDGPIDPGNCPPGVVCG